MEHLINNLKGIVFKVNKLEDIEKLDDAMLHEILHNHRLANIHNFKDKELMKVIYDFQYRKTTSNLDMTILSLLYKSDQTNLLKLYLVYPFLTEAFIRYGRENVNILEMKIKEEDVN